jgi:AcrR family transcriptional regulator
MKSGPGAQAATRRAILDALAHVVVESTAFGFSVQEVADRAGVSHRTVYNHFPTREALVDGLADHVEDVLSQDGTPPDCDPGFGLPQFPQATADLYRVLARREVHARAYVILMVASRLPAKVARNRLRRIEGVIERDAKLPPGLTARQVGAAFRMFVSSLGWHALTEHHGLTSDEAAEVARWATQTLFDAVRPAPPAPRSKETTDGRRKRRG